MNGRFAWISAGLLALTLSGCSDGSLPELNRANIFQWSQWEEDRRWGPAFDDQLAELRDLQRRAPAMAPNDQLYWIERLTAILKQDSNPILRSECARTLAAFPGAAASAGLQIATADKLPEVRIATCAAWGQRGGPEASAALAQLATNDAETDVRLAAIGQLARYNDQQSLRALAQVINDRDPAIQFRAIESLRQVTGRDYGSDVNAWGIFLQGGSPPEPERSIADRLRTMF
ncbi:MAG: HEAT repeat domain-containing protein [Pirellulaceae bacterium]|jgi:hypothetical protein|nr:HEAT repeat domain-containing protein [Pirellulaceae bacterium]MDP7019687.1 HEAT repeat domain-containing protein [Pirellulaceae bacterium]